MDENQVAGVIGGLLGGLSNAGVPTATLKKAVKVWAENPVVWDLFERMQPNVDDALTKTVVDYVDEKTVNSDKEPS